jgi:hypothetical protein
VDPNLFHVDWDRLFEVLIAIIVLSFFVERALALLFENRHFVARFDGRGIKELISFGLAFLICWRWQFDAISMVILTENTTVLGESITAGVIAGGSKASLKLFHDVMNVKSSAVKEKEELEKVGKTVVVVAAPKQ